MNPNFKLLFILFIFFSSPAKSQCKCESKEAQEIFKLFKEKAELYNAKIDWQPVEILLVSKDVYNRPIKDMAGISLSNEGHIFINVDTYNWQVSPIGLLFHELGHYYLKRHHFNSVLDENNTPASIMASWYYFDFDLLSNDKKEYYYKELFTSYKKDAPDSVNFLKNYSIYYKSDSVIVTVKDKEGNWLPFESVDGKDRVTKVDNENFAWNTWVGKKEFIKFKILTKRGNIFRVLWLNQLQSFDVDLCVGYSVSPSGNREIKYSAQDLNIEEVPITFIKPNATSEVLPAYDLEMLIRYPNTEIRYFLQKVHSFSK